MLEALVILFLGRNVVGKMAENKGYSGSLFTALFAGWWFIGEILGFLVGFAVAGASGSGGLGPAYLMALTCAGGGAFLIFLIALMLPDSREPEKEFDRYGRPKRRPGSRGGRVRRQPRRRPPEDYEDEEEEEDSPRVRRRRRQVEEETEDDERFTRRRFRDDRIED